TGKISLDADLGGALFLREGQRPKTIPYVVFVPAKSTAAGPDVIRRVLLRLNPDLPASGLVYHRRVRRGETGNSIVLGLSSTWASRYPNGSSFQLGALKLKMRRGKSAKGKATANPGISGKSGAQSKAQGKAQADPKAKAASRPSASSSSATAVTAPAKPREPNLPVGEGVEDEAGSSESELSSATLHCVSASVNLMKIAELYRPGLILIQEPWMRNAPSGASAATVGTFNKSTRRYLRDGCVPKTESQQHLSHSHSAADKEVAAAGAAERGRDRSKLQQVAQALLLAEDHRLATGTFTGAQRHALDPTRSAHSRKVRRIRDVEFDEIPVAANKEQQQLTVGVAQPEHPVSPHTSAVLAPVSTAGIAALPVRSSALRPVGVAAVAPVRGLQSRELEAAQSAGAAAHLASHLTAVDRIVYLRYLGAADPCEADVLHATDVSHAIRAVNEAAEVRDLELPAESGADQAAQDRSSAEDPAERHGQAGFVSLAEDCRISVRERG
uniref:Endo/exonuclease/phosphatase domain-containing protein n=1 Tax=Macrostomum lignano TaxID=282301 RepID=A0A1I8G090_9PLAT